MTKKTEIKLTVTSERSEMNIEPHYTVKVDGKGFPYIVWQNEKIVISTTKFPFETTLIWGMWPVTIDIVDGLDSLITILADPELTVDRLNMHQLGRIA